jgi:hypothetical protein
VPTIAVPRGHGAKERAFAHPTSLNYLTRAVGDHRHNSGDRNARREYRAGLHPARVSVILVDFTVDSKARSSGGLDRIFSPDAGASVFLDVYDYVPLYGQQTGEDRAALPYACTIK